MTTRMNQSFSDLLVQRGLVLPAQMEQARAEQRKTGDSLFKVLARLGAISQEQVADFIADQMGLPRVELTYMMIDPALVKLVPESLARRYQVVPVVKAGNSLTCAVVDASHIVIFDRLAQKTGLTIEPAIATEDEIARTIDELYMVKGDMQELIRTLDDQKAAVRGVEEIAVLLLQDDPDAAPVVQFVNLMIAKAVAAGASDIHVEPEESSLNIRYRIDGILHLQPMPPRQFQSAIVSRIKIMSNLDIAEHRKPQDGRIRMQMDNRRVDIRVSFLPTVYGENVVMRLLDTGNILLGLEKVGLEKENLVRLRELLARPNGIILVTGPTGSGKTTTLYASVSTINDPGKSIVTIEDPVEYRLPGIRQTQVDMKVDLTFSRGLRAILRQDPDVIMIGEIRDAETAQIAIQAALTGHLVLATLHTNNAAGAVTRLIDIGVEPFLIASSVIAVMAQRLVRLTCRDCGGKGCRTCSQTGYRGRSAIYELLTFDDKVREQVLRKASTEEIHRAAVSSGMQSLRDNGMDKVSRGLTTQAEVFRVTREE